MQIFYLTQFNIFHYLYLHIHNLSIVLILPSECTNICTHCRSRITDWNSSDALENVLAPFYPICKYLFGVCVCQIQQQSIFILPTICRAQKNLQENLCTVQHLCLSMRNRSHCNSKIHDVPKSLTAWITSSWTPAYVWLKLQHMSDLKLSFGGTRQPVSSEHGTEIYLAPHLSSDVRKTSLSFLFELSRCVVVWCWETDTARKTRREGERLKKGREVERWRETEWEYDGVRKRKIDWEMTWEGKSVCVCVWGR